MLKSVSMNSMRVTNRIAKRVEVVYVRNEDEITSPFMHPIFRPSLIDMKIEKSSHRPAMLRFSVLQINQIRPKYGRLNREVISSSFLSDSVLF